MRRKFFGIEEERLEELVNLNEIFVFEVAEEEIKKRPDICTCAECLLDIAALALNKLTPKYSVTTLSYQESFGISYEDYKKGDVSKAVCEAIEQVKSRPHH